MEGKKNNKLFLILMIVSAVVLLAGIGVIVYFLLTGNSQETTKIDADVFNRWNEHFVPFLLAGALLVLVSVSLSMSATRRMA